ncbi:MAG: hypothetical protein AAF696_27675 [Bacteroidota bacterium]
MRRHIFFLTFLFCALSLFGQRELQLTNSKKIDPNRYADKDGDPYLFKNWLIADVTDNDLQVIKEVFINYNGFTEEFEIKNGDNFIELENKYYLQIEARRKKNGDAFPKNAGENIVFQRKLHKQFQDKFVRLIHRGEKLSIIENFKVRVSEVTFQDVGKTVKKKRFVGIRKYYLLKDGTLTAFSKKRSSIIKTFGGKKKKQLDVFMRKEKIDLAKDEDIGKLFSFYEEELLDS